MAAIAALPIGHLYARAMRKRDAKLEFQRVCYHDWKTPFSLFGEGRLWYHTCAQCRLTKPCDRDGVPTRD